MLHRYFAALPLNLLEKSPSSAALTSWSACYLVNVQRVLGKHKEKILALSGQP